MVGRGLKAHVAKPGQQDNRVRAEKWVCLVNQVHLGEVFKERAVSRVRQDHQAFQEAMVSLDPVDHKDLLVIVVKMVNPAHLVRGESPAPLALQVHQEVGAKTDSLDQQDPQGPKVPRVREANQELQALQVCFNKCHYKLLSNPLR